MTIGTRIKNKREELGIAQVELARKIGCTKQTIYKYENDIVTNIPSDNVEKLANALNTTPAYLMGWDNAADSIQTSIKIKNLIPLSKIKTKKVPLIGSIACGAPITAVENIEEYIDMDTDIHADFALRCKGDSMINARIFDGDIVYIREQPMVENGEIAAVIIDDMECEATLKRVYIDDEHIILHAENPVYKDMAYYHEEMNQVRIIGKAVAFLSPVK